MKSRSKTYLNLVNLLLIAAQIANTAPTRPTNLQDGCSVTTLVQDIALAQKVVADVNATGKVNQTDLSKLTSALSTLSSSCIQSKLNTPKTSACYPVAKATEAAINKLSGDSGKPVYVVTQDVIGVITALSNFEAACIDIGI